MRDATENVWVDKNLITANSAAGLDWAKAILEYLDATRLRQSTRLFAFEGVGVFGGVRRVVAG